MVRPLADRIGRADNCDGAVSLLSHMGYRPTANRSLHKRPANARQFDDLTAALARSSGLIPDLTDGHIARPPFAADRAVAGQRMEKGGSGNPTHGRQDKSVAVVGRFMLVRSVGYGDSRRKGLLALFGNFPMTSMLFAPSSLAFG